MHSHYVDRLLFKVPQRARKTSRFNATLEFENVHLVIKTPELLEFFLNIFTEFARI